MNTVKITEAQILHDDILSTDKNDILDVFEDLINSISFSLEDRKQLLDALEKRRVELKNNV